MANDYEAPQLIHATIDLHTLRLLMAAMVYPACVGKAVSERSAKRDALRIAAELIEDARTEQERR